MALIDIYKAEIQSIHSHGMPSFYYTNNRNVDLSYNSIVDIIQKPFLFGFNNKELPEFIRLAAKENINNTLQIIDSRADKKLLKTINIFDSINNNKNIHLRGLLDIGNWDGVPISLNNNLLYLRADHTSSVNAVNLSNEFESQIERFGLVGGVYNYLYPPTSVNASNSFANYPGYPEYCIFSSDYATKFGLFNITYKVGASVDSGANTGDIINGTVSGLLNNFFLFDKNIDGLCVLDMNYNNSYYLDYEVNTLASSNFSLFVSTVVKFRASDPIADLPLLRSSNDVINLRCERVSSDVINIRTVLPYTDLSNETLFTKDITINLNSYHVLGYLIDHNLKNIWFYIDGRFITKLSYNQTKTVESLGSTFDLYIGGNPIDPTNSELLFGQTDIYDIGKTELDGRDNTQFWLDNNIPEKLGTVLTRKYKVIA